MENVMRRHKQNDQISLNREYYLNEITLSGSLLAENNSKTTQQPKKENKIDKIMFKTMKEEKVSNKKTKTAHIILQLSLPSIKNDHTIPIEEKSLKLSFACSFRVTAHITNR